MKYLILVLVALSLLLTVGCANTHQVPESTANTLTLTEPTESPDATAVSCGDTAISDFTSPLSRQMLFPSKSASPSVGSVRQESIFIVVVFPAPFTPRSENSSPSLIQRDRLSTASVSLYFFVSETALSPPKSI